MDLYLSPDLRRVLVAAAAEAYPHESIGYLLGPSVVGDLYPAHAYIHQSAKRTWGNGVSAVTVDDEPEGRVEDLLEDLILAGFHSHPNAPPTPSEADREHLDDYPELILSIWPSARGWRCRFGLYYTDRGRLRRGRIHIA